MSRTVAVLLMTGLCLGATAASAHPRLQASNPAAGAMLKAAPKDIRMSFSETLVPSFTGLELKNAGGKSIPTGKTMLVPGDSKKIVVPIGSRLTAGTYNVAWHAVSVDTHRISGSFSFKVMR
ncbi:MAG TPA: copper homeostasis periplasmic binding protein CopC [Rhizomicrobium sp.]|nr:copper homeostasis periplasmic binding protein CopC [Rhizomicrobium sp.]